MVTDNLEGRTGDDSELNAVTVESSQLLKLAGLKPHPRNYRTHPDSQIEHLMHSITEHGFYRNIVVANDGTILAGHGVAEASRRLGLDEVAVIQLDIDPDSTTALKILAADNYLPHFSEDDDRALTNLLREVSEQDDLFGTGFDEQMLAALVMVTRPAQEIADMDAAAEWAGMPEFDDGPRKITLMLHCNSEEAREQLVEQLGVWISNRTRGTWAAAWPPQERQDIRSLLIEG